MPLSAKQVIKNGDAWGKVGSSFGDGFRRGFEDALRQQQQLELLEIERQIQMDILERQRQIQIEILERELRGQKK